MKDLVPLVRGELLKLRTTKSLFGLTIGATLFSCLTITQIIIVANRTNALNTMNPRQFAVFGANAYIFSAALGVITMANEARHHLSDSTYLATPNRTMVLGAKVIAVFIAGFVMGLIAEAAIFAVGIPWLSASHIHLHFDASTWINVISQSAGVGLVAALGVAVGAIVVNQVAGIIITVGWLFIVEQIVGLIWRRGLKYLMNGLLSAMAGANQIFPRWEAFALVLCYILVLCGIGAAVLEARDLT